MNVLLLSPGYPPEMPFFTRGLAQIGVNVIGLGDQHQSALPPEARDHLAAYYQCGGFANEQAILDQVQGIARQIQIHRVECLWEPLMILAARLRAMLGL